MIEAVVPAERPVPHVRVIPADIGHPGVSSLQLPPGRDIPAGGPGEAQGALSARERQIIVLIANGQTDRQMADLLAISPKTVSNHVTNILRKLQVRTRAAAVARTLSAPHGAATRHGG